MNSESKSQDSVFVPKLTTCDWNDEWMSLQKARHKADNAEFWNEKAKTFHIHRNASDYIVDFIEFLGVLPGESDFDMGCGTGAISLPLARAGHEVMAADFSQGMLDVLEEEAQKQNIGKIKTMLLSWSDDWEAKGVAQKSYDVATASRSIATDNLKSALEKLSGVAKRRCAITLPTGSSPRTDEAILSEIGIQSYLGRDYIYAFMILVDMGYLPEVRYIPSVRHDTYDSEEEAYDSLKKMVLDAAQLYVSQTEIDDALSKLKIWLENNLVSNPDVGKKNIYDEIEGALTLKNPRKVTWAHIAWNV